MDLLKAMLLASTRISEFGEYRSPNVCFIADDNGGGDGGQEDQGDGEAEGAGEPGGEEDEDGDEGDEGADDDDLGALEGEDGEGEAGSGRSVDRDNRSERRRGASDVIRDNKRRAKEAERERDELKRRIEAAERRAEAAERTALERRQAETEEQERARVELMTDAERFEHYRRKDREAHAREMQELKFQQWDMNDRSEFRAMCREDPLVARVKDRVEAEYERLKAQGRPVSREVLANLEIGKLMREKQATAGTRQRKRAEERVQRETTRPPRTRSDTPSNRQRRGNEDTPAARRARLEGVTI
jgi:hypothetical protein